MCVCKERHRWPEDRFQFLSSFSAAHLHGFLSSVHQPDVFQTTQQRHEGEDPRSVEHLWPIGGGGAAPNNQRLSDQAAVRSAHVYGAVWTSEPTSTSIILTTRSWLRSFSNPATAANHRIVSKHLHFSQDQTLPFLCVCHLWHIATNNTSLKG